MNEESQVKGCYNIAIGAFLLSFFFLFFLSFFFFFSSSFFSFLCQRLVDWLSDVRVTLIIGFAFVRITDLTRL